MADTKHNPISHEADSANVPAIGRTGLALAVGIGAIFVSVYGVFQYLVHHPVIVAPVSALAETDQQQFPPAPRIQEHPASELNELHSREDNILSTYGWADRKAGIVRIPIGHAMELQLKRGFPVRKDAVTK